MTLKDKLEVGLKEDAPYRKDNLPDFQVRGPEIPAGPGRSPQIPLARRDKNIVRQASERRRVKPRRANVANTRKSSPSTRRKKS